MRVLTVAHGFPPLAEAGAEIYACRLARTLGAGGVEVSVLARECAPDAAEYRVRRETREGLDLWWVNNTFRETRGFAETYDNQQIRAAAGRIIDRVQPDVAHVHHLTGLATTILDELHARGVPVVMTLHDYWLLCHRGQLLDVDLRRCAGPTPSGCARCIGPAAGVTGALTRAAPGLRRVIDSLPPAPARWLRRAADPLATALASEDATEAAASARIAHMQRIGPRLSAVLAPSGHMRTRAIGFGFPPEKVRVWALGFDGKGFARLHRSPASTLRLGFLGSLMVSKAPGVLLDAFARLPAGRATLTLAGATVPYHGDRSYPALLESRLRQPGVSWRGPVPHTEVPRMLAEVDVLVVPSIWEENSPLVIGEAFLAGVPVVASRVGGIPELVTDGTSGLLVEPGNADDLHRALVRLLDEPGLLPHLRAGLPAVRTIEDDAAATLALYESVVHRPAQGAHDPAVFAVVLNYHTPDETRLAVGALAASRTPLAGIIVVDNESDGSCRAALGGLGVAECVENTGNPGFAAGVNQGIRAALARGATHVLLVNSDVVLPPDTVGRLLSALDEHPAAGIAGPMVLSRASPGRITSAGMTYSRATGRMRHRLAGRAVAHEAATAWSEVDGISGCVMLVDRAVFASAGFLGEEYFFSFEDLAFCLDARSAGFSSGVVGTAVAYHEGGRSVGPRSPRRLYYAARNHLLLASRFGNGGPLSAAARGAGVLAFNLAHALRAPGSSVTTRLAAVVRGVRDHLRGRYGPDPSG